MAIIRKVLLASAIGIPILYGIFWFAFRQPTPEELIAAGKKLYEKKDYPAAEIQFLKAIDQDNTNREARYLLALSYYDQDYLGAAARQLNDLLDYFPEETEASIRLGKIYIKAGGRDSKYYHHANEIAQKILSKAPDNAQALALWGDSAAGLGNHDSALPLFEKSLSLNPKNVGALVSLGRTQTELKHYPEAEHAFLEARQIDPKDIVVLASLATYYRLLHETDKADAVYSDALSLYPSDKTLCLQAVDFYLELARFDKVEKVLLNAQANTPRDPAPALLLSDLYVGQNRSNDAQKLLFDLKVKLPGDLDVASKLASNLLGNDPALARTEAERILKADPNNPMGNIVLGQLEFAAGRYDSATAIVNRVITAKYPQPHFVLGNIATSRGQVDLAQDEFQKALEMDKTYLPARVALAELFMNKGRTGDARAELTKVLAAKPGMIEAELIKANLDTMDKNYTEAERQLNALVSADPNNPLVHRQMAIYLESRGRIAEAERSYLRALELRPDSPQLLQDLAQFDIRQKQPERAIEAIQRTSGTDNRTQAFHYELMGLVYFRAGKLEESEKAFKLALEKDPALISSDAYLAAQYVQSGHADVALKQLDEIKKKNPQNASTYAIEGLIYQMQGKIEDAKQSYLDALRVNPNYDTAANNLAYIMSEEGIDLYSAMNWAQLARKRQPDNPHGADTLGWIYFKLHDYANARDQLKFAVSREPDNPVFLYHLGMTYMSNTQIPEAQAALRKAVSSSVSFKERNLAQMALKEITVTK